MARSKTPRIHQFHSGSAVADAVTNSMFFAQSILQDLGFESHIFVEHLDPALRSRLRPLADLRPDRDDVLLIHHSMGHDAFDAICELKCRKILVYHNITPPYLFSGSDPSRAYAIKGYSQLSQLREIVEAAIAISPFNADQLRQRDFENISVIPLLKDFDAIRYAKHSPTPYYDELPAVRLLFVGRVVPHKCQHELIEFIDEIRSIGGVPLHLVLVGQHDEGSAYKSSLDDLIRRSRLDMAVKITGRVGDPELFGWYRAANVYVSLSEHEGFGVPLIEAMALDLPVIAYASTGVPGTMGEAGIQIHDKSGGTLLDQLVRLREDRAFRRGVIRAQRQRVLQFSRTRVQFDFERWLVDVGAHQDGERRSVSRLRDDDTQLSTGTHYVIEGPFETSYSLAIVNRNLALSLNDGIASTSYIEAADGEEGYAVNEVALSRLNSRVRELVRPAPLNAERIVTIRNTYPPRPNGLLGDLRVLHLAWEESLIPHDVSGLINLHLDGIIVPSEYTKRALRNSGVRVPISVIGHGIDHAGMAPRQRGARASRGMVGPSLPFTFLHVSSGLARKGIEELITAYCITFSNHDPVLLLIKTFDNSNNTVDNWIERLTHQSSYSPAIQVISEDLDARQMEFLYEIADVLVLPSRGEGFNLPAAEAMARGIPVITSYHSGHLDFCNEENSYLIDCTYEISSSHLNIPNSYWARPSIQQLASTMRQIYRAGRSEATSVAARVSRAQDDVSQLRWQDVAEKVDTFVKYLSERPVMEKRLRLAWISTYNARCGIAAHSAHLLEFFQPEAFDLTIIADDQEAIEPDPENVVRLWRKGGAGLARVIDHVVTNQFDTVVIQYNLGFFDPSDFANLLLRLTDAGVAVYVILHRTKDLESDRLTSQKVRQAFHACTRIFVHNLEDINRLRKCGIVNNIVLVPHGVMDRSPLNAVAVRSLVGLSDFHPVIGTFGFLLAGKGLIELVHSFALLLRAYPKAFLLMVNSEYPTPESAEERERCIQLIRELQLEEHVKLINEFVETDEALFLLSACDLIVFPYQESQESASGAVRFGLAAGRPVLATPLPVFSDLSGVLHSLPGRDAWQIAAGIISFLRDENLANEVTLRQRRWVRANSWAVQAERICNIILASFEEAQGMELRFPTQGRPYLDKGETWSQRAATRAQAEMAAIRKLFAYGYTDHAASGAHANAHVGELGGTSTSAVLQERIGSDPTRGIARLSRLFGRAASESDAKGRLLAQADRSRDARDWSNAAKHYREVLDIAEDPAIWVQYGHALKESGNLDQAEHAYRASLRVAPDLADTHLQLGHVLKLQGRKIEASAAYFRALVLNPALDYAAFELRGLGWTQGRIEFALRRERS